MATRTKRPTQEIVSLRNRGITVLSSPLLLRGLRELPHNSRWSVKQAFAEARTHLAISKDGHIAAYSSASRELSQCVEISDAEMSGAARTIVVPDEPFVARPDFPAAFAWDPKGEMLVAASGTWHPELHLFNADAGEFAGRFGAFRVYPAHLCWSESGKYFAASSDGSENAKLTLWMAGDSPEEFEPLCEMDRASASAEPATDGDSEGSSFFGFGGVAFRQDEKLLAVALEHDGDWSDDSLLLLRVPTLEVVERFETNGQVTQLSWRNDRRTLIFCASGQAYSLDTANGQMNSLPFAAELCECHPSLPLCAFYNSWLKNSAAGRIFIADLQRNEVIDECHAEGIADVKWSNDGRTLYCVALDGVAYLFDCPAS